MRVVPEPLSAGEGAPGQPADGTPDPPPPARCARASSVGEVLEGGPLSVRWRCAPDGSVLPDRAL
eukprot:7635073-Alexandrium_andersonii.AAC.1